MYNKVDQLYICIYLLLRVSWTARRSNQSFFGMISGNQSWKFTGRTDAEAEATILWPPHVESWLIGKDPDVEKDWRQEQKGTTEDEIVGWHHRLNEHEFEQALGVDGQGRLVCYSPWGLNEWDMTEQLDWTDTHLFLGSFLLQVITEYWVALPMLYSRLLSVIYFIYSSVYMSTPVILKTISC